MNFLNIRSPIAACLQIIRKLLTQALINLRMAQKGNIYEKLLFDKLNSEQNLNCSFLVTHLLELANRSLCHKLDGYLEWKAF